MLADITSCEMKLEHFKFWKDFERPVILVGCKIHDIKESPKS